MGADTFMQGLRDLGYQPFALPDKPDHIVFDYVVETGRFAGRKVRHGLVVPADFPLSTPSGPHVTPDIHPIKTEGAHPMGAVHRDQAMPFQQALGGEWQYWSRPASNWPTSKKSVATYMAHIWCLWDSQ